MRPLPFPISALLFLSEELWCFFILAIHPLAQSQKSQDSITMAAVSITFCFLLAHADPWAPDSQFPPLRRARSSEVSTSSPPIRISEVSVSMRTLYNLEVPLKALWAKRRLGEPPQ